MDLFNINDRVRVSFHCRISNINGDGTFNVVRFPDGLKIEGVHVKELQKSDHDRGGGSRSNVRRAVPFREYYGPRVEANRRGKGDWYQARVIGEYANGYFEVMYDGSQEHDAVKPGWIRIISATPSPPTVGRPSSHSPRRGSPRSESSPSASSFHKGYSPDPAFKKYYGPKVEIDYHGSGRWLPGRVIGEYSDGRFKVLYDHNDETEVVTGKKMRIMSGSFRNSNSSKSTPDHSRSTSPRGSGSNNKAPPTAAEASRSVSGGIIQGSPVHVYGGRGMWHNARVVRFRDDDETYDVIYDNGDSASRVESRHIRLVSLNNSSKSTNVVDRRGLEFKDYVGPIIEANYKGRGNWYKARILGEYSDGCFQVRYEDDQTVEIVAPEWIRIIPVSSVLDPGSGQGSVREVGARILERSKSSSHSHSRSPSPPPPRRVSFELMPTQYIGETDLEEKIMEGLVSPDVEGRPPRSRVGPGPSPWHEEEKYSAGPRGRGRGAESDSGAARSSRRSASPGGKNVSFEPERVRFSEPIEDVRTKDVGSLRIVSIHADDIGVSSRFKGGLLHFECFVNDWVGETGAKLYSGEPELKWAGKTVDLELPITIGHLSTQKDDEANDNPSKQGPIMTLELWGTAAKSSSAQDSGERSDQQRGKPELIGTAQMSLYGVIRRPGESVEATATLTFTASSKEGASENSHEAATGAGTESEDFVAQLYLEFDVVADTRSVLSPLYKFFRSSGIDSAKVLKYAWSGVEWGIISLADIKHSFGSRKNGQGVAIGPSAGSHDSHDAQEGAEGKTRDRETASRSSPSRQRNDVPANHLAFSFASIFGMSSEDDKAAHAALEAGDAEDKEDDNDDHHRNTSSYYHSPHHPQPHTDTYPQTRYNYSAGSTPGPRRGPSSSSSTAGSTPGPPRGRSGYTDTPDQERVLTRHAGVTPYAGGGRHGVSLSSPRADSSRSFDSSPVPMRLPKGDSPGPRSSSPR